MENGITIFNDERFGEIRTAGTADNPLFCLSDICKILDLQTSKVKARLNERGVSSIPTPTHNQFGAEVIQEMIYVNEQNLYKVIMRSDKPQAEPFQDWVCGEVLPSIRKTGSYSIRNLSRKELALMVIQAEEENERLALENKQQAEVIAEQKPKVVFADAIVGSQSSCLIGELAKIITQNGYKIGQNRLFEWLRKNHFLGTTGEYYNIPNQKYVEQGLFEIKKNSHSENGVMKTTSTPKVTGKGQQYFVNLFLKNDISLFTNSDFNE